MWPGDGRAPGSGSGNTPSGSGGETSTPKVEYTIVIEMFDNESGDTVTASPDKGVEGVTVTLSYTVMDNMVHYNQLDFGGVNAAIASVEEAGTGTRTYTINAADSSNGVITITAVFTHTDLIIDHIAFSEHDRGHITKTYGDAPFTNATTGTHIGSGTITYHSSDTNVATVNSSGQVTILKAGSTVISAEKPADGTYAHAQTTYTLTVNTKPVTITGLSASDKVYDGTTTATVTGTAVINGLISGDTVTVIAGTASFADSGVGNNKTVTFSGWSLGGADAGNYTLSAQPASVTANIAAGVSVPAGMVYVSPGTFQRGQNLGSGGGSNQTPVHQVTLTRGFYMARYEVTQDQYVAVMGSNPSNFQTAVPGESGTPGKLPVDRVSWFSALLFCNKLSIQEGLEPVYSVNNNTDPSTWGSVPTTTGGWSGMVMDISKNGYRLPTEAEWEYAAKGGDPNAPGWTGYTFAGSDTVGDVAWYNSNTTTHAVGQKAPNALGLYDMSGNVFEWCWDRYAVYTSDAKTDPTGPSTGNYRIVRGGSVRDSTDTNMRSVYRNYENPQTASAAISYGFRLVRSSQ